MMFRSHRLSLYAAVAATLVILFAVFIAFRHDTALIGALSAAGTVAAGGFAALAAVGSMRAAAESGAAARRTREALARSAQPTVIAEITATEAVVRCAGAQTAADVMAVWILADGESLTERAAQLDPGAQLAVTLPKDSVLSVVWVEYHDTARIGQWRDTWNFTDGLLSRTESSLEG
jgi:hypothetical protein